jgi:hypothetical protein
MIKGLIKVIREIVTRGATHGDQASRSIRWHHKEASRAPTTEGPGYRDNHIVGQPPLDLKMIF